jgi:uncharacterized membrane protein
MPLKMRVLGSSIGLFAVIAMTFAMNGRIALGAITAVIAIVCGVVFYRWRKSTYAAADADAADVDPKR